MFFLGDLGSLMWIPHIEGKKIHTPSLGTRERSSFYPTNQIVIALKRRGRVC
jgi:hypothetical protein